MKRAREDSAVEEAKAAPVDGDAKKQRAEEDGADAPASAAAPVLTKSGGRRGVVKTVEPDSFEPENHFYPRVLNSTIHPVVAAMLNMSTNQIVKRFCHLNPSVTEEQLKKILCTDPKYFRWAGCDTFNVTDTSGARQVVVIETNSCPSGQKSMPLLDEQVEEGGYRRLIETTFKPLINRTLTEERVPGGKLAVVYDKNPMEATGYAAAMAGITEERVYLVEYYNSDADPPVYFENGVMFIRVGAGTTTVGASGDAAPAPEGTSEWIPVRAAFRYVTQRPWNRIPISTRTLILNPIIACLAGGRNKLLAAKAYDLMNSKLASEGVNLRLKVPETVRDVSKIEVPLWVKSFGGHAVVKVPYSNAGQGVYTILCDKDLADFMAEEFEYDKFIVQSLIGNSKWSSVTSGPDGQSKLYHVGTIPNRRLEIFVTDVRMMIHSTPKGLRPCAVYARRARDPLLDTITDKSGASWGMLGTNLSVKQGEDAFTSESNRLVLMDRKDFTRLGIGIDDLIEAFVQTSLAALAIDDMCSALMKEDGSFNEELFNTLNDDHALLDEIHAADTPRAKVAGRAAGTATGSHTASAGASAGAGGASA